MDQHTTNGNGSSNGSTQRPASFLQNVSVPVRDDRDPAGRIRFMPPNFGEFPVSHISTFQGYYGSAAKVYRDYDEAIKASLDNARYMRNDCGVMECIEARQRAVCLLNWHIEPEDEKSHEQKELCEALTKILQRIRRFTEYRYNLMHAIWYGKYAIQHRFGWQDVGGKMRLLPTPRHRDDTGWLPINGDKLVFRHDATNIPSDGYFGQMGIRVGQHYSAGDTLMDRHRIEATERGMAYFLSPWQRNLLAVHKHTIEDAAYEDGIDAGTIHGVGIRSRIYWEWVQKQESLAFLMEYLERSAGGIELWHFPAGNAQAKAEVEEAAKKRIGNGRNLMLVPIPMGDDGHQYGVQVIEPGMAGIDTLHSILTDYFGHRIKRYILGQVLSSEAEATGLGSGVAELHLDTLMQIIRYDAQNLEETLTFELLRQIQTFNFPKSAGIHLTFRVDTESPDVEKKLEAWARAYEMGCRLRERDVMDMIGAAMPAAEDRVLQKPDEAAMAGGMGGQAPAGGNAVNPAADSLHSGLLDAASKMGDGKTDGDDDPEPRDPPPADGQYAAEEFETGERIREGVYSRTSHAESIAAAAAATEREPSDEQKQAGNYRKGKFSWNGLTIAIETPNGATRRGKDRSGKPWAVTLPAHYGYILRNKSEADGDHVDVFVGPHPETELVFVVDQQHPGGRFDEHKTMIGFRTEAEAREAYQRSYSPGWQGLRSITAMTLDQFREWLDRGDTGKPVAGQVSRYAAAHWDKQPRDENGRWVRQFASDHSQQIKLSSVPAEKRLSNLKEARAFGLSLRGIYKNADTGWDLHVIRRGLEDTIARHNFDYRALSALPELLENAVHFSTEEPKEGSPSSIKAAHIFYAPLRIGDEDHLARLVVLQHEDERRSVSQAKVYNLSHKKSDRLTSAVGVSPDESGGVSKHGEPAGISIDQLIDAVKEFFPQHVTERKEVDPPYKPGASGEPDVTPAGESTDSSIDTAGGDDKGKHQKSDSSERYSRSQHPLNWDESAHPRDEGGQFAEKEAGASGKHTTKQPQPEPTAPSGQFASVADQLAEESGLHPTIASKVSAVREGRLTKEKAISAAISAVASSVLGREFGESSEAHEARRPDIKKLAEDAELLRSGSIDLRPHPDRSPTPEEKAAYNDYLTTGYNDPFFKKQPINEWMKTHRSQSAKSSGNEPAESTDPPWQKSLFGTKTSPQTQLFEEAFESAAKRKKQASAPKQQASLLEQLDDELTKQMTAAVPLRSQKAMFARSFSAALQRYSDGHPPAKGRPTWQKVGGASVFVNANGKITKGCPGLKGEHVADLIDEPEESRQRRETRQAHAEARGLQGHEVGVTDLRKLETGRHQSQHAAAKEAAKLHGVSTADVLARMPDAHKMLVETVAQREAVKEHARRITGLNAGNLARIENTYRDHSTVPGFDTAARTIAIEHPELGLDPEGSDVEAAVWDLIREGRQDVPALHSREVAHEAALMLAESKRSARRQTSPAVAELVHDFDEALGDAFDEWQRPGLASPVSDDVPF
jgi:phage gp29-like protein